MMTEQQREHIEKRLQEERDRAANVLRSLESDVSVSERDASGELSGYPTHPADRGTDTRERDIDLTLLERQRERLRVIDDGVRRLEEDPDHYDISVVSGRQIPFTRLDLIPWTRVCVDEEEPGVDIPEPRGSR